jgi:hypothetical protein
MGLEASTVIATRNGASAFGEFVEASTAVARCSNEMANAAAVMVLFIIARRREWFLRNPI